MPWHRSALQNLDESDIIRTYGAESWGIVGYYLLANDIFVDFNVLEWDAKTSMLKTLAAKYPSTVSAMAIRYKATTETLLWAAYLFRGQDPPRRQTGPGSPGWGGDTPRAQEERGPHRPCRWTGARPSKRADPSAPGAAV